MEERGEVAYWLRDMLVEIVDFEHTHTHILIHTIIYLVGLHREIYDLRNYLGDMTRFINIGLQKSRETHSSVLILHARGPISSNPCWVKSDLGLTFFHSQASVTKQ